MLGLILFSSNALIRHWLLHKLTPYEDVIKRQHKRRKRHWKDVSTDSDETEELWRLFVFLKFDLILGVLVLWFRHFLVNENWGFCSMYSDWNSRFNWVKNWCFTASNMFFFSSLHHFTNRITFFTSLSRAGMGRQARHCILSAVFGCP